MPRVQLPSINQSSSSTHRRGPDTIHPRPQPQFEEAIKALGERRFALVTGRANPEPSELASLGDDSEAKAAAGGGGGGNSGKGVPFFWASVLTNQDAVSESITRRDRLALEYVRDVRRVGGEEARGVELVFDIKVRQSRLSGSVGWWLIGRQRQWRVTAAFDVRERLNVHKMMQPPCCLRPSIKSHTEPVLHQQGAEADHQRRW